MSELAFNLNGDPFDPPSNAIGWRVRRFKSKGAPEVVYGRQGTPLVLPIDAGMDDLRREVRRAEGRYRLDALDEDNRPIAGAPPAYVCIHVDDEPAPAPEAAQVRNQLPPGPDHALIEAMRINSELARTVIEKFPMMLESSALLLRAADNAGMPARPPRPFELIVANDDETGDEANDEPEDPPPAKQGGVMGFMEMLLDKLAPEIVRAVLTGKLQVPGGLGALLDGRRALPATETAEMYTTGTPAVGPAPGRRVPVPAASSRATRTTHVAPRADGTEPRAASGASGAATASAPPAGLPTIDQGDLSHFTAILDALSLRERMYAQALIAELSADELRAWVAELKQLPLSEAVTKIRAVLGATPEDTRAAPSAGPGIPATTGGAS